MKSTAEERILLVSSDAHIGPPLDELRAYCPKSHLERFDDFVARHRASVAAASMDSSWDAGVAERIAQLMTPAHYDSAERLKIMDEDGIVAEVIFHGSQNGEPIPFLEVLGDGDLGTTPHRAYSDLAAVGIHIYNRWLADFCSKAPDRHLGVAQVPIWDLEATVREVEWAVEAGLRGGVNFPAPRDGIEPYNRRHWNPLWEVCAHHELVLNTHVASGGPPPNQYDAPEEREGEGMALYMADVQFACRRALPQLTLGGVFERYPTLRLVLTEQQGMWLPNLLSDLDSIYLFPSSKVNRVIHNLPSEYVRSNVSVGMSFMSRAEALQAVDDRLEDLYLWGSDFPHVEGTYPHTDLALRATFAGLPIPATRKMLGENAVKTFNLDRQRVLAIANRLGPTVESISLPLDDGIFLRIPGIRWRFGR